MATLIPCHLVIILLALNGVFAHPHVSKPVELSSSLSIYIYDHVSVLITFDEGIQWRIHEFWKEGLPPHANAEGAEKNEKVFLLAQKVRQK